MKPAPFEYHAPTTVAEVVGHAGRARRRGQGPRRRAEPGADAQPAAGPLRAPRRHRPRRRAAGHRAAQRHVVVGAATRDAVIERDPTVAADVPLLAAATPYIGHFQIRNRGTIGGSLAHADPAAEYPAVAVALDATFELAVGERHRASVPAADFFTGVWSTALEADELLTVDRASRCGPGGTGVRRRRVRPPPRRLRHRRRGRRRRARRRRRASTALRDRRVRRRRHARAGHGGRGGARRAAVGADVDAAELGRAGGRRHRRRRRRPAGAGGATAGGSATAMVADAWRRAVGRGRRTEHDDG